MAEAAVKIQSRARGMKARGGKKQAAPPSVRHPTHSIRNLET